MTNTQTGLLGDKPVQRIGYGAMQLAGPGVFGPPRDPDGARAVLRRAVELGVDHIDTAQFYGPDVTNELIRSALHPYPAELRLVTKIGARRDAQGAWLPALAPAELRSAVEDNLRSLAIERIDLVNLRVFAPEGEVLGAPTAEQLGTLADLRDEGKLDLIGVSNTTRAGAQLALDLVGTLGEVQNPYSLLDRSDDATIAFCEQHGIAYVPYFPLGSAFTGGPARIAADPLIGRVAAKHAATPTQVALAWLLHRSERILLIPGTSSVAHLEENLGAAAVVLDADDMATLAAVEQAGTPYS
ncbi:oxidoreductase [Conexibacter sp. JD483]|uniref:oxidoreductase n=1 Tax=unclassified Conexibacter TaxID=2627773 RepID=UPI0027209F41|nr:MULTISPECIES: oxidoreductase [unclassified Conexibacter]MDO8189411.1 oxidoreductase [Conexibacter sp. CPCC 205706]MDO8202020.1 oxidoreductase [Conexibacter sp. CPCC 205762]MDR9372483.1 oxidoreductase [Conexibacter sp. JD483]